jgi:hypothetical protein
MSAPYGVELVYELRREVWEGDIDAALNFAEVRPHEGTELLVDRTDVPVFGPSSRSSNWSKPARSLATQLRRRSAVESRALIGRCLLLLSAGQEILSCHGADAISVLVGENQEHLCEDHTGSHNGSAAGIGTYPQKIGASS